MAIFTRFSRDNLNLEKCWWKREGGSFPWIAILVFSAFLLTLHGVQSHTFTAIVKLQQLPGLELELLEALKNYTERVKSQDEKSSRGLNEFWSRAKDANTLALEDDTFMEKPTNAFLFVRRLAEGWGETTGRICGDLQYRSLAATEFCQKFETIAEKSGVWPSKDDLIGAASAIVRLTHFYNLSPEGLANGTISDVKVLPLSPDDFIFISDVAKEDGQDYLAATWYHYTLRQLQKNSKSNIAKITGVERKLAEIYYRNSMYGRAVEIMKRAVENNPSHKSAQRDLAFFKRRRTSNDANENSTIARPDFFISKETMSTYQRLCSSNIKTKRQMSELYCEYRRTAIPLIPSRVEYANLNPPVVLIHHVVNENEMSHIKEVAKSYLQRSVVGDKNAYSPVRISQSAWLGESDAILLGMTRKVELHTGLSAVYSDFDTHAEPWQVLNYGLGGLYVPHDDSVKLLRDAGLDGDTAVYENSGDRVATFLLYLNDVTAGGATVYPYLKARVPVVKGAAALWYNLFRNGNPDYRHLHAGCPVLIGSKWVSNKWIREIGQAFKRPCALNENL